MFVFCFCFKNTRTRKRRATWPAAECWMINKNSTRRSRRRAGKPLRNVFNNAGQAEAIVSVCVCVCTMQNQHILNIVLSVHPRGKLITLFKVNFKSLKLGETFKNPASVVPVYIDCTCTCTSNVRPLTLIATQTESLHICIRIPHTCHDCSRHSRHHSNTCFT